MICVRRPQARAREEQLPAGWHEARDHRGRAYYYNHITKKTQWTRPKKVADSGGADQRDSVDVGGDWIVAHDHLGRVYYWNKTTGKTQWEAPAEVDADEAGSSFFVPATTDGRY